MTQPAKKYTRQLKRELFCSRKDRKRLLLGWQRTLTDFLEEHPEAGEAQLTASFGTPEEMAKLLMREIPASVQQKHKNIQRLLPLYITIAAVAIILTSWIAIVTIDTIAEHLSDHGYIVTGSSAVPTLPSD